VHKNGALSHAAPHTGLRDLQCLEQNVSADEKSRLYAVANGANNNILIMNVNLHDLVIGSSKSRDSGIANRSGIAVSPYFD